VGGKDRKGKLPAEKKMCLSDAKRTKSPTSYFETKGRGWRAFGGESLAHGWDNIAKTGTSKGKCEGRGNALITYLRRGYWF